MFSGFADVIMPTKDPVVPVSDDSNVTVGIIIGVVTVVVIAVIIGIVLICGKKKTDAKKSGAPKKASKK